MNKAIIVLALALCCNLLDAQTLAKNDQLKFDADYYLMEKDFNKALNTYQNILKSEPDNADIKYKIGICYLNSEDGKERAIPFLEEAVLKVSEKHSSNSFKETNAPVDALFLLGSAYRVNNQLDKAIAAYSKYKNFIDPKDDYNIKVVDQYIRNCNTAMDMLKKPINLMLTNIGAPVNNEAANFNAVFSGDGKTVVYTTQGRQGYDIFTSLLKDTAWTTPKNITSVLGTGKYMKTTDLSNDGLTLLLTLDDPMNADIFISNFSKGRWSKAEALGKEINSKTNETHASLSTNGQILFFTSDRKGGQGDLDIYKAEKNSKGIWSDPVNMGPMINTPFNEATPFLSEDDKKLYFSSEGHDGLGGYDIFYCEPDNPGLAPVNVGYPLNTTDNDLFFVPSGNGLSGYYSFTGEDTYGGRDIYRLIIEEKAEDLVEIETPAPEEDPAEPVSVEPPVSTVTIPVDEVLTQTAIVVEEPVVNEPVVENLSDATVSEEVDESIDEPVESESPVIEQIMSGVEKNDSHVTVNAGDAFYRVQIMALRKPVDISFFRGLTDITMVYMGDNWYRYTLGNTTSREKAEMLLTELVKKGYKDAFIRSYGTVPQYTIQVMAVPGPVVDLKQFSGLLQINAARGLDNFCRYTTGEFSSKEEALSVLENIKLLGYRKAFVTRVQ